MKTDIIVTNECTHDLPLSKILLQRKDIDASTKSLYCELCCHANRDGKVEYSIIRRHSILLLYNPAFLRRLEKLKRIGLLKYYKEDKNNIVLRCKNKNLYGKGWGWSECEWCGIRTTTPEDHHYPITRNDGGKATVSICQNCHNEYHHPQIIIQLSLNDIYKGVRYLMSLKRGCDYPDHRIQSMRQLLLVNGRFA